MKRLLPFSLLLLFFSCNSKTSTEKDDMIRSHEQKIKELEERLNKMEETRSTTLKNRKAGNTQTYTPPEARKNYYSIGSTESEVLEIQGEPTSIDNLGGGTKYYSYGLSTITFENGKVESFSNLGKNLKIRVASSTN